MTKVKTSVRSGWRALLATVVLAALVALAVAACGDDPGTASSTPSSAVSATPSGGAGESSLLLWRFKTGGQVVTSPVVADGLVIVGGSDGYLCAVDTQSGQERWRFLTGNPSGCSPVIAGGTVYVASNEGLLYAVDIQSGEERWTFKVGEPSGYARSLAASGRAVYIIGGDGRLRALDGRSGRTIWTVETDSDWADCSPAAAGGMVYMGAKHGLEAYDAATGKKLWTYRPWRQGVYPDLVVSGGMVCGRTGGFINAVWAVDAQTGRGGWSLPSDWPASSSPALSGGVAYFTGGAGADDDRRLRAVDARTGEDVWASQTGWDDSPLAASGGVLCVVCGKTVYAVDAKTGDERWQFEAGGRISESPAVSNGVVYAGDSDGFLYAVGSR